MNTKHEKKDAFTQKMYLHLFTPALCSAFGLAAADMADAIVVGRRMGEVGLAAIGISLPLFMLIDLFMHGFGIGGSVRCAQLLGEGRPDDAVDSFHRVVQGALAVAVGIALAVNLLPGLTLRLLGADPADAALYAQTAVYVRLVGAGAPLFFLNYILNYYLCSDDQSRRASAGTIAGTAADLGLNLLLVLALDLGTLGAGLATLAGSAVSIAVYLPGFTGKRHTLCWRRVRPDWREALHCFRTGVSSSAQYAYQMAFLLIANHVLMDISGGAGVAVFDVVQNASYLILYLYQAAAKALQPLAGTFYGEKNDTSLHRALRLALGSGLAWGAGAAILISLFPQAVCALFGLTGADALAAAPAALRLYCLSSVFAGVSTILESACQAVEQERGAFVIATLRGAAVLLPVTLLLAFFAPAAFWWVFPVTEALSLALYLVWQRRAPRPKAIEEARILHGTIRSRTEDIAPLTERIGAFCERWDATPRQSYLAAMATEEIGLATIENAFRDEDGVIAVTLIACEDGDFELHLRDNAALFNPFSLETDKARSGGQFDMDAMGMLVVKKQAKSFFYRQYQGFNTLVVRI